METIDGYSLKVEDSAQKASAPDYTAKLLVFTDGSGSKGKCTSKTPAGWAWASPQPTGWLTAAGPVITDPYHTAYLGAMVGSNNTGEISAIIEALLYSRE